MKHPKRSHIWLLPFFYLSFCTNEVILRAVTARGFWQSGLAVACLFVACFRKRSTACWNWW